jgi:hypothetical protein
MAFLFSDSPDVETARANAHWELPMNSLEMRWKQTRFCAGNGFLRPVTAGLPSSAVEALL